MDLKAAIANQLKNIENRTGKTLEDFRLLVAQSGKTKFGEQRDYLKNELGLGHGDANAIVKHLNEPQSQNDDPLIEIYSGPKEVLLPLHSAIMNIVKGFGEFEIAPKKGYISLRRKKQFAMVGPATKTQIEIGFNMKGVAPNGRLIQQPPGGMCQYKIRISDQSELDQEFEKWLQTAYESAG